jgi:uncharacterized RDD family membrane protein YckC
MALAARPAEPPALALTGAPPYVGLVTRILAFAVDAAIVNAIAILVAAAVSLFLSVVSLPEWVDPVMVAVAGGVYLLWNVGYFVAFWATTGQTPGGRLLRMRVVAEHGGPIRPLRGLLRFGGLTLAAIPLFAGFFMILFDDRRRGLHDRIARTLVLEADPDDAAPVRRATRPRTPERR